MTRWRKRRHPLSCGYCWSAILDACRRRAWPAARPWAASRWPRRLEARQAQWMHCWRRCCCCLPQEHWRRRSWCQQAPEWDSPAAARRWKRACTSSAARRISPRAARAWRRLPAWGPRSWCAAARAPAGSWPDTRRWQGRRCGTEGRRRRRSRLPRSAGGALRAWDGAAGRRRGLRLCGFLCRRRLRCELFRWSWRMGPWLRRRLVGGRFWARLGWEVRGGLCNGATHFFARSRIFRFISSGFWTARADFSPPANRSWFSSSSSSSSESWPCPACPDGAPPPRSPRVANFFGGGLAELDAGAGGMLDVVGMGWGTEEPPKVRSLLGAVCSSSYGFDSSEGDGGASAASSREV